MSKYSKAPSEFVMLESQNKQLICKTCHNALKRGALPAQAKANKNLFREDGSTSMWQAACHSWTSCQRTNRSNFCVYPSPKASISSTDGSDETEEEAML